MICYHETIKDPIGGNAIFLRHELEDFDRDEVRRAIIEAVDPDFEDFDVQDVVDVEILCPITEEFVLQEVLIGDYFSKNEWNLIKRAKENYTYRCM